MERIQGRFPPGSNGNYGTNNDEHWTPAREDIIRKGWLAQKSVHDIVADLARADLIISVTAVYKRSRRLGLHQRPHDWTEERVARLVELQKQGYSASKIASAINAETCAKFTRNSIIGKLHRMGISSNRPKLTPEQRAELVERRRLQRQALGREWRASKPRKERTHVSPRERDARTLARMAVQLISDNDIPEGQRQQFHQLEPNHCRWMVGHPSEEHFYCGGAVETERPFCSAHCRAAYMVKRAA